MPIFYVFSLFILLFHLPVQAACPPAGSGLTASGSTVISESNCQITTSTQSNYGTNANSGGIINLSDSSIATTGSGAIAAFSNGTGSLINLINVSISTQSVNGIVAQNGGNIFFDVGSISTAANSTNGAVAQGGTSSITLNDVSILCAGTSAQALSTTSAGNSIAASNCQLTTTNTGGITVQAFNGSNISLQHCDITAQGSSSFGAVVARDGSAITVTNGSTITSQVYGVHTINGGASILVENTAITILGSVVFGAYAQNQTSISLFQSSINTIGNISHGFFIQDGSVGNVTESQILTSGTDARGIWAVGFSAGNQVNVLNSDIETIGDGEAHALESYANAGITNQINAENSNFQTTNASTISVSAGAANINFKNVAATALNNHLVLIVDGNPTSPAALDLTARSSQLSGDMQVFSGNTGNVSLTHETLWTGAALDLTNLNINNSRWNLTANSSILNQLTNAGFIDFVSQGNIFKTLTVNGNYHGDGLISLNTLLEGDGSPSDMVVINGGTATGHTFLLIKNTTGTGQLTSGDGILVVNAINGGITTPHAFSLTSRVIAGPYEYFLYRGSASSPDSWFLRSQSPIPPIPPVPPRPHIRSEVSLYTALPSLALLYGRTLMDTLQQRVGDEELLRCNHCIGVTPFLNGFWMRLVNTGGYQHGGGIFRHGPNFDYQLLAVQLGVDLYRRQFENGIRNHFGVLGAIGTGWSTVKHHHFKAGKNRFDVYTNGFYCTFFGPSGWYLDTVFQTSWYDEMHARSRHRLRTLETRGYDVAGSVEGGFRLKYQNIAFEPQIQVVHQDICINHSRDPASRVAFKRTFSTAGRIGSRVTYTWTTPNWFSAQPRLASAWFRTNFWREFQGKSRTFFPTDEGPRGFSSHLGGTWFQGDLGVNVQLSNNFTLYSNFGGNVYLNGRGSSYNILGGIRGNF